jgi:hypothetical protein
MLIVAFFQFAQSCRAEARPRANALKFDTSEHLLVLAYLCCLVSVSIRSLSGASMSGYSFEILVDESLSAVTSIPELQAAVNKRLLSSINDFEDGKWRYPRFQSYLWDNIAQTALSERERAALVHQSHSALVAAARNLRLTDKDEVGQGSEIAEVFLYGVMKQHFNALPVVPKIFYKQNAQDNAKGADSVHIVIDGDDFTLWFGEAKFYNSIADARLDAIVDSVVKSLSTDKLRKENSIITNVSDIDYLDIPPDLRNRIKDALKPQESLDIIKSRIHVPILILHECDTTSTTSEICAEYRDKMVEFHQDRAEAYFTKQLARSSEIFKYDQIKFHIILFPVPKKKIIVDAFLANVSFYKGQA